MANGTYNPLKWDYSSSKTWGYIAAGAAVGATSGFFGAAVATSGIPMANTACIIYSSLFSTAGTHMYTGGQTDVSVSFGAASYNIDKNEFGYLGNKDNTAMQNVGYGFGALANVQDLFAGINGGTVDVYAKKELAGHSWIEGEDINISVGPSVDNKSHLDGVKWESQYLFKTVDGVNFKTRYSSTEVFKVKLQNVSVKSLKKMTYNLNTYKSLKGMYKLKYGVWNGCVNQSSRALLLSGVLNVNAFLPITAPVLLNAELVVRNYAMLFSYQLLYTNP